MISRAVKCGIAAAALVLVLSFPVQASPPFETPLDELEASLTCSGPLDAPGPDPVLLIHGTGNDSTTQFSWNWVPALDAIGIPHCRIELKSLGSDDIQISAERVVYAILTMHAESGDPIDIVGHSQGGMIPRWALKYWPETRAVVDDFVGLAPSNHGTPVATANCAPGECTEAVWQQRDTSNFVAVLNNGPETFAGIEYTVVYTLTDEIVVPQVGPDASSPLRSGDGEIRNVALQEVCPNNASEHFAVGTYDPVAYALTLDALGHTGPADPTRVPQSVCAEQFMPGVDPVTFPEDFAATVGQENDHPLVTEEPPIKPYALPEPRLAVSLLAGIAALAALREWRSRPARAPA